jgi:dihydroorotase
LHPRHEAAEPGADFFDGVFLTLLEEGIVFLVAALVLGLRDGTIDVICTDHAPHHYDAKEREFDDAPNGIIGLETALGLALTELVDSGLLRLSDLVNRMSTMPARIFNLPGGTLAPGAPGDVVVIDPAAPWTVRPEEFFSKSRNTPVGGRRLKGRADTTIVRGQVVFAR